MTPPHFLAFIGPTASLAVELESLKNRITGLEVIAPAVRKKERFDASLAIARLAQALAEKLEQVDQSQLIAKLSVWAFEPSSAAAAQEIWGKFGTAAWIEYIDTNLKNKDSLVKIHIEKRIIEINSLIHHVSREIIHNRNKSPLPIPFHNFQSNAMFFLKSHWYKTLDEDSLLSEIRRFSTVFRQTHSNALNQHRDDRDLLFEPALPTACHGAPHPTGNSASCYLKGRFRFGSALFPGFHYDVKPTFGNLRCTLVDCEGTARDLRPEKRRYINVFPNDHLLPQ